MRYGGMVWLILACGTLHGQNGQGAGRPGWPCVPGRAVDPSYIEISESTGGQLFLFQKHEVAQSAVVMSASHTHPATVLRAIGTLSGTRDFEFPIESSVESMLVLASVQCRNAVEVTRPGGQDITPSNSPQNVELQAGRILRVDQPEPGRWRVRLTGTGLFVLSVLVKAEIGMGSATGDLRLGVSQEIQAHVRGTVSQVSLQLVDATGNPISDAAAAERTAEGVYRTSVTPRTERYRVLVTGLDAGAWPFQRMYPALFKAQLTK